MNVDRCNILLSMNCNGFNAYKVAMVVKKSFGQINTRKTMIVIEIFVIYFVKNENIFLDETEGDGICGIVFNALFDISDTNYARKKYVSGIHCHKYDIHHIWYEKYASYREIAAAVFDDMKHIIINCDCNKMSLFNGDKHNYNYCAKIWQRILNARSIFIHLKYKLEYFTFDELINTVSMLGNVEQVDGNYRDEEGDIAILKTIINKT